MNSFPAGTMVRVNQRAHRDYREAIGVVIDPILEGERLILLNRSNRRSLFRIEQLDAAPEQLAELLNAVKVAHPESIVMIDVQYTGIWFIVIDFDLLIEWHPTGFQLVMLDEQPKADEHFASLDAVQHRIAEILAQGVVA